MRRGLLLLLALSSLLAGLTLARIPAAWESGNALNHVSASWMTLADDLFHGTFYRPLHDPAIGYGGTRNFPLAFALHAAVMRAGLGLLPAGYAVSLGAGILAALGLGLLLRRAGLSARDAALLAPLALAGIAAQSALTAIRGDLLPVALTALGLSTLAGPSPERRRLPLAAALLALAFIAKITALTGLFAGLCFLALRGERRAALRLAVFVGALGAALLVAIELLSGGRFLALMSACASGGADAMTVLSGPVRMLYHLRFNDRPGLALLVGAILSVVATRPRERAGWRAPEAAGLLLATTWLVLALGSVVLVFGSPGTAINHFVELEVASVAVIGAALARVLATPEAWSVARRRVVLGAGLLAVVAGLVSAGKALWQDRAESRLDQVRAAIAALPRGAPMLSEDALVPLLAGQRPLVLDTWMLRLVAERDPGFSAPLVEALNTGNLPSVVLLDAVEHPNLSGPAPRHLGTPVVAAIRQNYRLTAQAGLYHVYAFAGALPQRTAR